MAKNAIVEMMVLLCVLLCSTSCKKGSDAGPLPNPNDSIPVLPGWTLVWHDEFVGPAVDRTRWSYEVNGDGGGNNELQYYTDSPKNSFIDSGTLVLRALEEDYIGKHYTSARMRTLNKGDWTYGRFEIRAKLPYGQGLWPAIWMLPSDWEYGGWPQSGEIDIMEMLGHETTKVYGTIHYGLPPPNNQRSGGSYVLPVGTFAGGFHTFALEWDSNGMKWSVDGVLYRTELRGQPFDKRFHMLLNVAVGGNWPGSPDASTTFPQMMVVDYVRVFQKPQ